MAALPAAEVTAGIVADPPVEVPIPAGRRRARPVAGTVAVGTGAGRQAVRHGEATPEARRQAAGHAEATPEADRVAALPVAGTVTTNDFFLVSPHTSLTVRRLRKGPPVLPENLRGGRGTDLTQQETAS